VWRQRPLQIGFAPRTNSQAPRSAEGCRYTTDQEINRGFIPMREHWTEHGFPPRCPLKLFSMSIIDVVNMLFLFAPESNCPSFSLYVYLFPPVAHEPSANSSLIISSVYFNFARSVCSSREHGRPLAKNSSSIRSSGASGSLAKLFRKSTMPSERVGPGSTELTVTFVAK
jgi:hypothetical protein